jgi:ubiquinone/menaquinone biosynthesis C-methylase UbiE
MAAADKAIYLGHPSYVWRRGQERRLALVRRYVSLENQRILDVGCGLGMYVEQFRRFSAAVYGVDVDAEKIAEASLRLPNLQVAAAEQLPFPDGFFDVVFLNEVIEHVADDRATIREAYRVLRPGGHIVIFAPNRLYPFETHGFFFRGKYHFRLLPIVANYVPDFVRNYFAPHVRIYTQGGIKRLFDGLDVEFVVCTHIYPGLDNVASRHRRVGPVLWRIVDLCEATPLRAFGISHFVVARKKG